MRSVLRFPHSIRLSRLSAALLGALSLCAIALSPAWAIPVDPGQLQATIEAERLSVPEFQKIAEEAKKRGLRVFLAGGLAASYGDFAKHQLLAKSGAMQIPRQRLEPQLYNVVMPAQDLDLVIGRADGTPESVAEIEEFKLWLIQNVPQTYDGITRWDLNGLKTPLGPRPAWEGDPDFARQNNDSLSIGLIEITDPPSGVSVIREAGHVASRGQNIFLNDLAGDEIHFLRSADHAKTTRAQRSINPEILGAIRALSKAFQFEKKLPDRDLKEISDIVANFNPAQAKSNSYVNTWLQTRAKRLVSHAYDPEVALATLHQIGLWEKLNQVGGNPQHTDSLSWWLHKAPLPFHPAHITSDRGRTAAELGIQYLEHETTPEAARQITWRYDGVPRAFISRNVPGENAQKGVGFYLKRIGATGWATRGRTPVIVKVDPDAREGQDFFVVQNNEAYRSLSSSKLQISPESAGNPIYANCRNSFRQIAANPTAAWSRGYKIFFFGTISAAAGSLFGTPPLVHHYLHSNDLEAQKEAIGKAESAGDLIALVLAMNNSGTGTYDDWNQIMGAAATRIPQLKTPPNLEQSVRLAVFADNFWQFSKANQKTPDPAVIKALRAPLPAAMDQLRKDSGSPSEFFEKISADDLNSLNREYFEATLKPILVRELIGVQTSSLSNKALFNLRKLLPESPGTTGKTDELLKRASTYDDFAAVLTNNASGLQDEEIRKKWSELAPRIAKLSLKPQQLQDYKMRANDVASILTVVKSQLPAAHTLKEAADVASPAMEHPSNEYVAALDQAWNREITLSLPGKKLDDDLKKQFAEFAQSDSADFNKLKTAFTILIQKCQTFLDLVALTDALPKGEVYDSIIDEILKENHERVEKLRTPAADFTAQFGSLRTTYQQEVAMGTAIEQAQTPDAMIQALAPIQQYVRSEAYPFAGLLAEKEIQKFCSLHPSPAQYKAYMDMMGSDTGRISLMKSELPHVKSVEDYLWILSPGDHYYASGYFPQSIQSLWLQELPKIQRMNPTPEQWQKLRDAPNFP